MCGSLWQASELARSRTADSVSLKSKRGWEATGCKFAPDCSKTASGTSRFSWLSSGQGLLGAWNVLGCIHAERAVAGANHLDGGAVFQSSELFKLLGAFQRGRFPTHKLGEKIAPVAVDSDVPEKFGVPGRGISHFVETE